MPPMVSLATIEQTREALKAELLPLIEKLEEVNKKMVATKVGYTTKEAADLVGVSDKTLRKWIVEGKSDARGVTRYLKAYQPTEGRYRIMLEDLSSFIKYF